MNDDRERKSFFMPIPAGTPYSIIAEATHRFNVELSEKPVQTPSPVDEERAPMVWVLVGDKEELMKAKAFIYGKLKEVLRKFE